MTERQWKPTDRFRVHAWGQYDNEGDPEEDLHDHIALNEAGWGSFPCGPLLFQDMSEAMCELNLKYTSDQTVMVSVSRDEGDGEFTTLAQWVRRDGVWQPYATDGPHPVPAPRF